MMFNCPPKLFVWQQIIQEFLWPTVTVPDIIYAIYALNFYNVRYVQKADTSAQMIIFTSLAAIWKGHFRSSFDNTSFLGPVIVSNIRQDISRQIQEIHVHSSL